MLVEARIDVGEVGFESGMSVGKVFEQEHEGGSLETKNGIAAMAAVLTVASERKKKAGCRLR